MKTVFIVNPNSSIGSTGQEWSEIKALARDRMGPFEDYITTGPEDATRFTRSALNKGVDLVVCVGGDGTLNEVVNGFMGRDGPGSKALLGFIPRGTGCDFVRTVGIPKDPSEALDLIVARHAKPVDVGRLEYLDHQDRPAYKYFHNVTSFGLGGEVDDRVSRTTKAFGGFLSFLWATLVSLLIYDKKHIHIRADNGPYRTMTCWNIAVAIGQYHGGGMWIAPGASVDDGRFQVTLVGDLHLLEVFWHLPKLYNGKLFKVKKVKGMTAKRIEAYSEQRVLLDVDGEQPGQLPVVAEIVPKAIRLIRP